jgi:hypothetical protein
MSSSDEVALPVRAPGAPDVQARWQSCEAVFGGAGSQVSAYSIARYDGSFAAVSALVCADPAPGEAAGFVERRSGRIGPVLEALQLPDVVAPGGNVCTADGELTPRLVLLDGRGRWVLPGLPGDVVCGKGRPEMWQALRTAGLLA